MPPDGLNLRLAVFVAAAVLLSAAALRWESALVDAALPAVGATLDAIDGTYATVKLSAVAIDGELAIERTATPAGAHALGGHVVFPDPQTRLSAHVDAGYILQPLVLALALAIAWPAGGGRRWMLRLAALAPALAALALLDVALALYGFVWGREIALLEPGRFSALVSWADFMTAGGRYLLAIAAAVAATLISRAASPAKSAPGRHLAGR